MKQFLVTILLSFGLVIVGGNNYSFAKAKTKEAITIPFDGMVEVLPEVYDDQQSTVYIKVKAPIRTKEDIAITEIVNKKRKWCEKFPAKKVITWSIVPGDDQNFFGGMYGFTVVVGLLIHYERQ